MSAITVTLTADQAFQARLSLGDRVDQLERRLDRMGQYLGADRSGLGPQIEMLEAAREALAIMGGRV